MAINLSTLSGSSLAGQIGATGPIGVQGATGAQGASGLQGSEGHRGASGSTGIDGASGATGHIGATGTQGASGISAYTSSTSLQAASIQVGSGATGATGSIRSSGSASLGGSGDYGVFYVDSLNEKIGLNLSTGISADTVFQLNRQTDGENYVRIRNFSTGGNNLKSTGVALDIHNGSTTANRGKLIATSASWNYGSIPANAIVLSTNPGDIVLAAGGSGNAIKFYTGLDTDGWNNSSKMSIDGGSGDVSIVNRLSLGATGAAGATGSIAAAGNVSGNSFTVNSKWEIKGASGATGALYFSFDGVNKAKLDSDGNFSVVGDVIAYETIT